MIRINLIGVKTKARKSKPTAILLVFAILFVIEAAILFVWYQKLSSELGDASRRSHEAQAKVEELVKVKAAWEQWQAEKADIDRQTAVFETLRADQSGPPHFLLFLSYMLTKAQDTPANADELKSQEMAGWNPKWDARRIWFKSVDERGGIVSIKGSGVDHEDVAEFYRRLESCEFIHNVEPGIQLRQVHGELGIKFVEFATTASLSYRVPKEAPVAAADTVAAPAAK
jgi:type IV pilus assembly protein PilN